MLEQYEEKKYLEYFMNFLKDKMKSHGANYFSKSNSHYVYMLNDVDLSLWTDKKPIKFGDELVRKTTELLELYSTVEIPSKIEFKIRQIARIYGIGENEKEILGYVIRKNLYEDKYDSFQNVYSSTNAIPYLTLNTTETKKSLKALTLKGLVSDCNSYLPIMTVFHENRDFSDKEICEIVFGKELDTNLEKSDFKHMKKELSTCAKIIKNAIKNKTKGVNILFYGTHGAGKTEMSRLIGKLSDYTLNEVEYVDSEGEYMTFRERIGDLLSKLNVIEHCGNRFLLFDEADYITEYKNEDKNNAYTKVFINNMVENTPCPIIWTVNNVDRLDDAFIRRMTHAVKFTKLEDETRMNVWKKELKKNNLSLKPKQIKELSANYKVSVSLIKNAVETTKMINGNADDIEMFLEGVSKAMNSGYSIRKNRKEKESKNENNKNVKYNPMLTQTDLDIKELTERLENSKNLNFSMCLYGEPGTGKSEYARHVAKSLGIKVVFKRASDLISKYVGETEENIAKSFKDAREKKAMLIIDEADSFLQSRSNANYSWEITMVNEMLTQMESFEYPFVCTTNLLDILDEATLRRFTFKIKFDFLTKEQVQIAFKDFFSLKISLEEANIKGLTVGDFVTVKKKNEFLGYTKKEELINFLSQETKLKKSNSLKAAVGF